jgi:hypothetical protein
MKNIQDEKNLYAKQQVNRQQGGGRGGVVVVNSICPIETCHIV